MNTDDPSKNSIDPDLEARVVAWVLGEASPFEAAELARRVAETPELAVFKRRIEAVHGLVDEAVRPVGNPMGLSPERRAKLLATIKATESESTEPAKAESSEAAPVTALPPAPWDQPRRRWRWQKWVGPIAACLTLGFLFNALVRPQFRLGPTLHSPDQTMMGPATSLDPVPPDQMEFEPLRQEAAAYGEKRKQLAAKVGKDAESDLVVAELQARNSAPEMTNFSAADYGGSVALVDGAAAKGFDANKAKLTAAARNQLAPSQQILDLSSLRRVETTATAGYSGSSQQAAVPLSSFEVADNKEVSTDAVGGVVAASISGSTIKRLDKDVAQNGQDANAAALEEKSASLASFGSSFQVKSEIAPAAVVTGRLERAKAGASFRANANAPAPASAPVITLNGFSTAAKKAALDPQPPARAGAEEDRPVARPATVPSAELESLRRETPASVQSVSTFSLHVSDVSFRLARAALARGERPDPATIRPEEFYNAFDYGDPAPVAGEPVSCRIEQAAHPFLQQRNLVRIAMKVPATGRNASQSLQLTVLLDTSGSMEREDRAASVRRAMSVLASLLGPNDRVTLIGFARQARLLADRVPGDQAAGLVELIARTPADGGTNLEEALKLAGEHARAQFVAGAQNRIVVLTDGAANLGSDDPAQLAAQVETLRQQGIAFDACGVGANGLDDSILEALTRKGDGRYYVINSPEEADAGFAHQLAGALRPAAENVKVQVRFNPARVRSYRLIGFEQHRLREEDFRNDKVDAAELAAEEAAVALYQVEVIPEGDGELGDVFVRFRNAASREMVERSWTLSYAPQVPAFARATPSLQLAGTSALLAEQLRGGALAGQIPLEELAPVVNALRSHYASDARVQELVTMFAQARRLSGP